MRAVTDTLAAAIESPDRVVTAKVGVDWHNDGLGDTVLVDRFDRTSPSTWGLLGDYPWSTSGFGGTIATTDQYVNGAGVQVVPAANAYRYSYISNTVLDVTDQDMTITVSCPTAVGGALEPGNILLRFRGIGDYYMFRPTISQVGQTVTASIYYAPTGLLASATVPGLVHSATVPLRVRAQAVGSRLRMKVWQGEAEPSAWHVATLHNTDRSGGFGVRSGVAAGATNTPATFRIHGMRVSFPSTPGEGDPAGVDDLSPAVTGFSLDRAVTGDLPSAVRLVQGSAAAQATVTLGKGMLRPDAVIEARTALASHQGATLVGPTSFAGVQAIPPWGARRGDYLLGVVAFTTTAATALPYLTADDNTLIYGGLTDPGWSARHVDVSGGTLIRAQVYGRWVSDADVYNAADGRNVPYTWISSLSNTAWTSVAVDIGPAVLGQPGVWKVGDALSAGTTTAGTVFTTPTIQVTVPGTILISVFAARTTTTAWSVTPDNLLKNFIGTHATTNVSLLVCASDPLPVGSYSRTATTAGSVTGVVTAIIAVVPQPGSDERHHAAWQLSPLNPASPTGARDLAALRATVDVELVGEDGPERAPRVRGYVRSLNASGDARTAELEILDRREDLRHRVVLPPIDGDMHGATATWPITYALILGGWTPCPRPRGRLLAINSATEPPRFEPQITVSMLTMHGSLWPLFQQELLSGIPPIIGVVDAAGTHHRPTFVDGPFVAAAHAYINGVGDFRAIFGQDVGYTSGPTLFSTYNGEVKGRVQFWVRGDTRPGTLPAMSEWRETFLVGVRIPGGDFDVYVGVNSDGNLSARFYETGGGSLAINVVSTALPSDGQWHFVGIGWDFTNPASAFIAAKLDDNDPLFYAISSAALTTLGIPGFEFHVHDVLSFLPMSDLQLSNEGIFESWLPDDAVVDAHVDPSILELVAVVDADPVEAWELITGIGAAENAVVYLDEDGEFHYRSRNRYLADQMLTPQVTLSATKSITSIRAEHAIDVVRNTVSQAWEKPSVVFDWVWSLPEPLRLAPDDQFQIMPFRFDDLALEFQDLLVGMTIPPSPSPVSYYIANTRADGSGDAVTVNLSGIVGGIFTSLDADIQWSNLNTFEVWITEARIVGRKVVTASQTPALSADQASVDRYGQQPLNLPSSTWIQTEATAKAIATRVRADLAYPQVVLTNLQVKGDPRLQLLDRVRIVDKDGLAVDGDWWITGIREQQSAGRGYTMAIDARAALPVGEFDSAVFGQAMFGVAS